MFLRPILSRICKHQQLQHFAYFSSSENVKVKPSKTANSLSKIKIFSSKEISQEKEYVVSYLMNSCGLSPEKAISASEKVHFDSPDKPNVVLNFLEKYGFSKAHIAELVWRRPVILLSNPEKSLLPKMEFFLHFSGISEADVFRTIAKHPSFLTRSLENQLVPVCDYLKDIIGIEKVGILLRRGSWVFDHVLENRLIPNVDYLRELRMPNSCIELSLYNFPDVIAQKHDKFKELVAEVQEMGFSPLKSTFVLALHARSGKGNRSLWAQCYETYTKWGWSEDDIHMAFRKHPNCMLLSEKKISKFLDFLVNKMGRESRMVARVPYVIFYNMERRVIPRCSILHLLSLNGFVKDNWSLTTVLCPAEKDFLDKYVTKYEKKLPQLYDIYQGMAKDVES